MEQEPTCPLCHSKLWKNGSRNGHTRYRCSNKDCNYSKTANPNKKNKNAANFFNNLYKFFNLLIDNKFNPDTFEITNDKDTKITIEEIENIGNLHTFQEQCFVIYKLSNKIKYVNYAKHEQLLKDKLNNDSNIDVDEKISKQKASNKKDDFDTFLEKNPEYL